jgi:hypothetical protein
MEDEDIPWLRRDAEPHRGPLLKLLANIADVLAILSICLVFPSLLGLALGLVVRAVAGWDLKKMDAGLMDPRGLEEVKSAQGMGTRAALLNGIVLGFYGLMVLFIWLMTLLVRYLVS